MENMQKPTLLRKLSIPVVAVVLVIGIVIYTGGFENFLKFLGIKASELQTIHLSTVGQIEGDSPEDVWLVPGALPMADGTGTFDSFSLVPSDPAELGFVMPIYSDANPELNTYQEHSYTSAPIDLGAEMPTLTSYAVQVYTPEGASVIHSYKTASSVEALQTAALTPVELGLDRADNNISTHIAQLGINVERYMQVHVEFVNDAFAARSAVYSWTLQYNPNTGEGDMNSMSAAPEAQNETAYPVTIDFSEAGSLPETIAIQILDTEVGVQPIEEVNGIATEQAAPLYNLENSFQEGSYVLVIRAVGFETIVVPFDIASAPQIIKLPLFVEQNTTGNFDLNGDGAINSLDLSALIAAIGATQPETPDEPLTEE